MYKYIHIQEENIYWVTHQMIVSLWVVEFMSVLICWWVFFFPLICVFHFFFSSKETLQAFNLKIYIKFIESHKLPERVVCHAFGGKMHASC